MKVSLLFTRFMLYKCNEKICKFEEIFGFEVSHPPLTPITKPTLRKPDAQQELCPHSELISMLVTTTPLVVSIYVLLQYKCSKLVGDLRPK